MAISTGGIFTFGRKSPTSSRNIALLSIIGVITGAAVIFRTLQPNKTNADERTTMRGGNADPGAQTDQGTWKSAPRPKPEIKKY